MHTAATWLKLAAHSRSLADGMSDPAERAELMKIVASYEQQARDCSSPVITPYFGACPSFRW
jgi:hypothetical protein